MSAAVRRRNSFGDPCAIPRPCDVDRSRVYRAECATLLSAARHQPYRSPTCRADQRATIDDVADRAGRQGENEEWHACMNVPMSEMTSAMSRLRKIGVRNGCHGLGGPSAP